MSRIDRIADNANESEKAIERYLRGRVSSLGGIALKYSNASETGFPDRLIILPDAEAFWCELKSRGKPPRRIQLFRIEQLRKLGQKVYVADSRAAIDKMIEEMYGKHTREENGYNEST